MTLVSRRQFFSQLAVTGGTLLMSREFLARSGDVRPFEMLVVGDSHVSGQGLSEKNKFYYLVKEWLRTEAFGYEVDVRLKVKAHSGSRIELHLDELHQMLAAGDDVFKSHHAEVNLSQPSIRSQVDIARKEYSDTALVDLVMLSGGITDVLVANTVNPFVPEKKLRMLIGQYCGDGMRSLLRHITAIFPKSKVVVVGYFPVISTSSDVNMISRYLFKTIKFPHPFQFGLTNGASKQFLKVLRKKMAERSRIWVTESNRALREAVARTNGEWGETRVIFIESPVSDKNCFGTQEPMLWGSDRNNLPADERYTERKTICTDVFSELKHHHYGKMSVRMCELAAIGHLNIEGSRATAEAIKAQLRSIYSPGVDNDR